MVTRDTPYLATDIFLDVVVKVKSLLLSVVRYLFNLVSGKRYLIRDSNRNILSNIMTDNVSVAR